MLGKKCRFAVFFYVILSFMLLDYIKDLASYDDHIKIVYY